MNSKILFKKVGLLPIWLPRHWSHTQVALKQRAVKQFSTWVWTHGTSGLRGFILSLYVSIF